VLTEIQTLTPSPDSPKSPAADALTSSKPNINRDTSQQSNTTDQPTPMIIKIYKYN
jgi:hypothetical protein